LPGRYGQQDLIAELSAPVRFHNELKILSFQTWHGFRYILDDRKAWESLRSETIRQRLGGPDADLRGENHRWRIPFSSDYRGR
jgi:hypothetical protein